MAAKKVACPYPGDALFMEACKACQAYCGEQHDYAECTHCPVLKMAERHEGLMKKYTELRYEMSWDRNPERMGGCGY